MKYIATISGGKDSVTMCDLLLKNNYPVDYIIFNDTLDEYEEMYVYLDKVDNYFKKKYNKSITRLKPTKTYEQYIFNVKSRGANIGKISGLPNPTAGFCEWRKISKIRPLHKWIKENNIEDYKLYIGITTDEKHRAKSTMELANNGMPVYPLIEYFDMSERDCQEYLIEEEMENPLYRHFKRTGCAKCQYKSKADWFNTWKHYPKVWEDIKDLEKRVKEYPIEAVSYNIFADFKKTEDLEKEFKKADKQGNLFNFSAEPLKDCFCKI